MASMSGHDVFQLHITRITRQSEVRCHRTAGKNVGIRLSDVIHGIHQRSDMTLRHHVIGQLAFLDVQFHADHISFRSPGINEHTHIGFSFEQRIKLRNVLLPGNGFFPVRDIDRTAGCRQRIVGRTEVSHPERRHKTHQFHRRKIILARNNTDHVLIFGAVHFRKLLLSFSNVQQVDD